MTDTKHVLVVDDHKQIRESVTRYLQRQGLRVTSAEDTARMNDVLEKDRVDLIVLDVMMPGEDGLSACARLREGGDVPILMLSALDEDDDRIRGLDTGADDYLAKPFNPEELLARIRAILRRTGTGYGPKADFAGKRLRFGHNALDVDARVLIRADGRSETLTSGEMNLLMVMLNRPRAVLSRESLLRLSAGRTAGPLDRTIDNQVSRLRRKIEVDPMRPRLIATIRNGGYSLACDVEIEE